MERPRSVHTLSNTYSVIAVMFYTHNCGCSLRHSMATFHLFGTLTPMLPTCLYVLRLFLALPATGRRKYADSDSTWIAQRDLTAQLSEGDGVALSLSNRIFFVPLHQVVTLVVDSIFTRASDQQVDTLSPRRAQNEVHLSDGLADSFFTCLIAVRFRRRGEGQKIG